MNDNNKALAVRTDDAFAKALEPTSFESAMKCAEIIHKTGIGGCKSPEEALVKIMAGRSQGMSAIDSLRLVYVVNGKPGFDATFIRAKCLRLPECEYFEPVPGEVTSEKATFRAKRRGREEQRVTFTLEQAKQAKLADKDNYKNWTSDMLVARATTQLARRVFPEATAGMYAPDELDAIETSGEVVEETSPAKYDELTGEVIDSAAHPAAIDHEAIASSLRTEIDAVKASGDKEQRRALIERIKSADLPQPLALAVREHYKTAFSANGTHAQQAST